MPVPSLGAVSKAHTRWLRLAGILLRAGHRALDSADSWDRAISRILVAVVLGLSWTFQGDASQHQGPIQSRPILAGESMAEDDLLPVARLHYVNDIWLNVTNYGSFGSGHDAHDPYRVAAVPVEDLERLSINWSPSFEFPPRPRDDYLGGAGLWFGGVKSPDTL